MISHVGSVATKSQWLHLQHQRCESVCCTLVQAYWAEDTHEDLDSQSSSDESRLDEDEPSDSSSSDDA